MCHRCDQTREKLFVQFRLEIQGLVHDKFPEGTNEDERCTTQAEREQLAMEMLIARAAVILSKHLDVPPSFACAQVAGVLMETELLAAAEADRMEQAIRNAAPFN